MGDGEQVVVLVQLDECAQLVLAGELLQDLVGTAEAGSLGNQVLQTLRIDHCHQ